MIVIKTSDGREVKYDGYGIWNPFEAIYDKVKTTVREHKYRDYVIKKFNEIFGRNPTEEEINRVFNAFEKNSDIFGDKLKDYTFVSRIQNAIKKVIPSFNVDGKFYYGTVIGIMKYQEKRGLPITGVLDKRTVADMASLLTDENLQQIVSGESFLDKILNTKTILIVGGIAMLSIVGFIIYKQTRE